ncbi:MAG TPA: ribonuclease P protein component [Steroidobacteraceae bacterium]|nr:ribonuclease P protein component [Steroidobacteraceae bacterium]
MTTSRNARVDARLTFAARQRLRRKSEFDSVHARGIRIADGYFAVIACANDLPQPRLGLAVSVKTAGNAVERNRIRRVIRETFRLHQHELPMLDIVVNARARARGAAAAELRASLDALWKKVAERCALPSPS